MEKSYNAMPKMDRWCNETPLVKKNITLMHLFDGPVVVVT